VGDGDLTFSLSLAQQLACTSGIHKLVDAISTLPGTTARQRLDIAYLFYFILFYFACRGNFLSSVGVHFCPTTKTGLLVATTHLSRTELDIAYGADAIEKTISQLLSLGAVVLHEVLLSRSAHD
jgi:hypothetical protein